MLLTVRNVGRILDLYSVEQPERGVTEVARELGISKSKAHALLSSMAEVGLLRRVPGGRYRPGWRGLELGRLVTQSTPFRPAARAIAAEIVRASGDTVHVGALDHGRVVYVDRLEGAHKLPLPPTRAGATLPAHCSGVGKILLAHLGAGEVDSILDQHGLPALSPNTITDRDRLYAELHRVRRDGVAHDREEVVLGLACVAAAIIGPEGSAVAAMSISTTPRRMAAGEVAYASTIQRAARTVSQRLRDSG